MTSRAALITDTDCSLPANLTGHLAAAFGGLLADRRLGQQFIESLKAAGISCPAEMIEAQLTPGLPVHVGAGVVGIVLIAA